MHWPQEPFPESTRGYGGVAPQGYIPEGYPRGNFPPQYYYPPNPYQGYYGEQQQQIGQQKIHENHSEKKWIIAFLLFIFLAPFGVYNFYAGRIKSGILQIVLCWWGAILTSVSIVYPAVDGLVLGVFFFTQLLASLVFMVWVLVDYVRLIKGTFVDSKGLPLQRAPFKYGEKSWVKAALYCSFLGVFGAHRFYVGKTRSGFFQLFLSCGVLIWIVLGVITMGTGIEGIFFGLSAFHAVFWFALGIWVFVDYLVILSGDFRDGTGKRLSR